MGLFDGIVNGIEKAIGMYEPIAHGHVDHAQQGHPSQPAHHESLAAMLGGVLTPHQEITAPGGGVHAGVAGQHGFFPDPNSSTGWSYANGHGGIMQHIDPSHLHAQNQIVTDHGTVPLGQYALQHDYGSPVPYVVPPHAMTQHQYDTGNSQDSVDGVPYGEYLSDLNSFRGL